MKVAYKALDISSFAKGVKFSSDVGPKPDLRMIAIDKLVIDPTYQRDVGDRGRKNILKIVEDFAWTRFEPVVCAPTGDGRFAIINGQHRTLAAKIRGIKEVPCAVVKADQAEQATAFTAINGTVTAVTSIQLHFAGLAAKRKQFVELQKVCTEAGVNICRYPVPANKMRAGDTLAAGALAHLLEKFGPTILTLALRCITETGRGEFKGNPGNIRSQIVKALCVAISEKPKALARPALTIKAVHDVEISELWDGARTISIRDKRPVFGLLHEAFRLQFNETFGKAA